MLKIRTGFANLYLKRPWTVNVWRRIIGNKLIGPHFIKGNWNGQMYRDISENELPTLLDDLSLELRQNMWFQYDGCPAHYLVVAREVFDRHFNGRWIGRAGPVNWPDNVYKQVPTTRVNIIE